MSDLAGGDPSPNETAERAAAVRILARSFYRELRSRGYTPRHLLALSAEIIALITLDLRNASAP